MKTAPEIFIKDGFKFQQIERVDSVAIYRKSKEGAGGPIVSFEVMEIRNQKAATVTMNGVEVDFPERESLPTSNEWGSRGWTFPREDAARLKLVDVLDLVADRRVKQTEEVAS